MDYSNLLNQTQVYSGEVGERKAEEERKVEAKAAGEESIGSQLDEIGVPAGAAVATAISKTAAGQRGIAAVKQAAQGVVNKVKQAVTSDAPTAETPSTTTNPAFNPPEESGDTIGDVLNDPEKFSAFAEENLPDVAQAGPQVVENVRQSLQTNPFFNQDNPASGLKQSLNPDDPTTADLNTGADADAAAGGAADDAATAATGAAADAGADAAAGAAGALGDAAGAVAGAEGVGAALDATGVLAPIGALISLFAPAVAGAIEMGNAHHETENVGPPDLSGLGAPVYTPGLN